MHGNAPTVKVHYKGQNDDFVVIVDSAQAVRDWKADKSVPLAQVVNGWKVFCTHKHGNQGQLDTASHGQLESEFGSHKDEDVVAQILEKGNIVESEASGRSGDRNTQNGPLGAHGGAH